MTYPYEKDCYTDPYEIKQKNEVNPIPLRFDNIQNIIHACSDEKTRECPITVVAPGNGLRTGYPTDTLNLHKVISNFTTLCCNCNKTLVLEDYTSWECDDYNMAQVSDDSALTAKHVSDLENLANIIPEFARYKYHADQSWQQRCLHLMKERQIELCEHAKQVLRQNNLIVLGSPGVNQVAENYWEILLFNRAELAKLKMYVVPGADTFPEQVFALIEKNCEPILESRKNNNWENIKIGWLQMVRNPWSIEDQAPRFLIFVGGFSDHGTQQALLKLNEYLDTALGNRSGKPLFSVNARTPEDVKALDDRQVPDRLIKEFSKNGISLTKNAAIQVISAGSEWRIEYLANAYLVKNTNGTLNIDSAAIGPALMVESTLRLPPLTIFREAERRNRFWTCIPTTFRGSQQDEEWSDLANYNEPYACGKYSNPYAIGNDNFRLQFSELDKVIKRCSVGEVCPVTIVFPGNGIRTGYPTDTLNLHKVVSKLAQKCTLNLNNYPSWECDDLINQHGGDSSATSAVHFKDDLEQLHHVCKIPSEWDYIKRWEEMGQRQEEIETQAKRILSQSNLIVIGSPGVNQVARNFWEILLYNTSNTDKTGRQRETNKTILDELRMYVAPGSDTFPEQLFWLRNDQREETWIHNKWADNNIGWLQMVKNPWAKTSTPRFLILIGGFRDHGTQAALLKLNKILTGDDKDADFCDKSADSKLYPAHVVRSKLDVPPLNRFLDAPRKDRGWTSTPTTFRGSIYVTDSDPNPVIELVNRC